jgi:hypothetical protein
MMMHAWCMVLQVNNPQSIIERGGRIICPNSSIASDGCQSAAFANKLVAAAVPDEL